MDMTIPPLKIKIMLKSSPLKSRILVQRLAVGLEHRRPLPPAIRADLGGAEAMRGGRNTVEIVVLEISNSTKLYPSVVHAYTSE